MGRSGSLLGRLGPLLAVLGSLLVRLEALLAAQGPVLAPLGSLLVALEQLWSRTKPAAPNRAHAGLRPPKGIPAMYFSKQGISTALSAGFACGTVPFDACKTEWGEEEKESRKERSEEYKQRVPICQLDTSDIQHCSLNSENKGHFLRVLTQ